MAIKLITDSSADLSLEQQQQLNVDVVNLSVNWPAGETCHPGNDAFYEKLTTAKVLPKTAAPSPEDFLAAFEKAVGNGDTVIAVLISSGMSATVQAAQIAREDMAEKNRIFIVDSLSATMGEQVLLFEADRMIKAGTSPEDIVAVLERRRHDLSFYAIMPDLKYAKMGGRVSASAATVGTLLNIHPIFGFKNGKAHSFAKARGKKAAYLKLIDLIKADNIDASKPVIFGYSYRDNAMKEFEELYNAAGLPTENRSYCSLGPIVGTHGGPGACGISFLRNTK